MRSHSLAYAIAAGIGATNSLLDSTTTEPCAEISKLSQNGQNSLFPAETALACLQSVPLNTTANLAQLRGMKVMYQFQSDLSFLADPPPGFLYPGLDLMGEIETIEADLQAGKYTNEYDFQSDVSQLITATYNFHTNYIIDIISVFSWQRSSGLFSFSTDGVALPQLYSTNDIVALAAPNHSAYTPSNIVQINGVEAETWMNEYAALNPWDHDPDANYNQVVQNLASNLFETVPITFMTSTIYQGNETVLTFANGTKFSVLTFASSSMDFTDVVDGESFYETFCTGAGLTPATPDDTSTSSSAVPTVTRTRSVHETPTLSAVVTDTATPTFTSINAFTPVPTQTEVPAPEFYPTPFVAASDNSILGFFSKTYHDLAIIVVPTFEPGNDYEFQDTFRSFLANAYTQKRTRLIIDLRGNGGGNIMDGYDMFKQLFPSIVPYGGQTIAAFPLLNDIGQVVSAEVEQGLNDPGNLTVPDFVVNNALNIDLRDFSSWSDFYGPHLIHGGNYSSIERYNLSDPNSLGAPIYGYANDTAYQPQVFDASNITILSDGLCGSTCAIFSEFMKSQAGVPAIAVGGRAQEGPMQWVGGSKGSEVQNVADIVATVQEALNLADASQAALFSTFAASGDDVGQMLLRQAMTGAARVNFKNGIRDGDTTVTPLHYVYEAADCRFFYTAAMFFDQRQVWDYAYKVQWRNGSCVAGSKSPPSSLTGSGGNSTAALTSYIDSAPPSGARGANGTFSFPEVNSTATESPTPTSSSSSSAKPTHNAAPALYAGSSMTLVLSVLAACFI